jgi:phosphatidylglycerophosphatase A
VRAVAWTLATWFGCGRVPKAPGTMGSLGAIPLVLLAARAGGRVGIAAAAVVVVAAGVWSATVVARETRTKDPQIVVVDEVAGMLVTMLAARAIDWRALLAGFLLFRAFDVVKPWPIRSVEKLKDGWGIVLDDVMAGVYAAAVMAALRL